MSDLAVVSVHGALIEEMTPEQIEAAAARIEALGGDEADRRYFAVTAEAMRTYVRDVA